MKILFYGTKNYDEEFFEKIHFADKKSETRQDFFFAVAQKCKKQEKYYSLSYSSAIKNNIN